MDDPMPLPEQEIGGNVAYGFQLRFRMTMKLDEVADSMKKALGGQDLTFAIEHEVYFAKEVKPPASALSKPGAAKHRGVGAQADPLMQMLDQIFRVFGVTPEKLAKLQEQMHDAVILRQSMLIKTPAILEEIGGASAGFVVEAVEVELGGAGDSLFRVPSYYQRKD
jgi:hypothetical protein